MCKRGRSDGERRAALWRWACCLGGPRAPLACCLLIAAVYFRSFAGAAFEDRGESRWSSGVRLCSAPLMPRVFFGVLILEDPSALRLLVLWLFEPDLSRRPVAIVLFR